jgi:hypothetical protein
MSRRGTSTIGLWLATATSLLLAVALLWASASLKPRVYISVIAGTEDSVFIQVSWQAVPDASRQPVVRYLEMLNQLPSGVTLVTDSTNRLADTLHIGRPAAGDSIQIRAFVAARDRKGMLGTYGASAALWVKGPAWIPPVAPPVVIDTTQVSMADSLTLFLASAVDSSTQGHYFVTAGDTLVLCAISWRGGQGMAADTPVVWQSNNPTLVWPIGATSSPSCERFATNPNAQTGALNKALKWAWRTPSVEEMAARHVIREMLHGGR